MAQIVCGTSFAYSASLFNVGQPDDYWSVNSKHYLTFGQSTHILSGKDSTNYLPLYTGRREGQFRKVYNKNSAQSSIKKIRHFKSFFAPFQ